MADFGGWEMPIEYPLESGGGVVSEHHAVRERVGLFDVSHLGKITVSGDYALDFLNRTLTNDLNRISDGQAQYTMLCNEESGGVVDDLIVYRRSDRDFLLVPNAANSAEVFRSLKANSPAGLSIINNHHEYGVLAIQGPRSKEVLIALGLNLDLEYMSFAEATLAGCELIICRTGYTGEFGYEVLPKWDDVGTVWTLIHKSVLELNGLVCGLGARDTLRTEMGYPLHGHELSLDISPVQAGASWAVGWKKAEFVGRTVLTAERSSGPRRILRGIILEERGVPRPGMQLFQGERNVGEITSGTYSPTRKVGIALALLSPEIPIDSMVTIDIRGKQVEATVVKTPFVPSRVR